MHIEFSPVAERFDACAVLVAKDAGLPDSLPCGDPALARAAAASARFSGAAGQIVELFVPGPDGDNSESGKAVRLLLVGLGDASEPMRHAKAGGAIVARLLTAGAGRAMVDASALEANEAAALAGGAMQRSWRLDTYRTRLPETSKPTLDTLLIVGAPEGSAARWTAEEAVAQGVAFTRELVSEPANILYPESFVARARAAVEPLGVECRVLDEGEMRALGMGALLGVAQGSVRAPQLFVMRWKGGDNPDGKPLVFVGKGVTFDTGGISIKPAAGMEDMKWDMGGAGAVAGAMLALAARRAKADVVGICGLVENMPDGNAQRPGDVVTSLSGQTVEVINTDAEGRLVLCDALTWAQREFAPSTIVDLATLTGAMIVSLGHEYGGLFANDDALASGLLAAGEAVGDPLWRFPLGKAYDKLIDSPIADMKNVGPRGAGSITAAQFLQRYIDDGVRWAHLDIAGMVWADKDGPTWAKGATGYGVRLLDRFVADSVEG